jgi:hypothetical protein
MSMQKKKREEMDFSGSLFLQMQITCTLWIRIKSYYNELDIVLIRAKDDVATATDHFHHVHPPCVHIS